MWFLSTNNSVICGLLSSCCMLTSNVPTADPSCWWRTHIVYSDCALSTGTCIPLPNTVLQTWICISNIIGFPVQTSSDFNEVIVLLIKLLQTFIFRNFSDNIFERNSTDLGEWQLTGQRFCLVHCVAAPVAVVVGHVGALNRVHLLVVHTSHNWPSIMNEQDFISDLLKHCNYHLPPENWSLSSCCHYCVWVCSVPIGIFYKQAHSLVARVFAYVNTIDRSNEEHKYSLWI